MDGQFHLSTPYKRQLFLIIVVDFEIFLKTEHDRLETELFWFEEPLDTYAARFVGLQKKSFD